jgi:hypothetical protein
MNVAKELAQVFCQAAEEVANWESWQRSLDPQGSCSSSIDNGEEQVCGDNGGRDEPLELRRCA